MFHLTYAKAIANAEHLIALGDTTVHLYEREGEADFPFGKVDRVEPGSSYRLGGPTGCFLVAEEAGLTFKLNFEFEGRDANGRGVSLFDRDKLRDLIVKLSPAGRHSFAKMLSDQVLPGLQSRTEEIRQALRQQADSEDCVRGLIAFAAEKEPA